MPASSDHPQNPHPSKTNAVIMDATSNFKILTLTTNTTAPVHNGTKHRWDFQKHWRNFGQMTKMTHVGFGVNPIQVAQVRVNCLNHEVMVALLK